MTVSLRRANVRKLHEQDMLTSVSDGLRLGGCVQPVCPVLETLALLVPVLKGSTGTGDAPCARVLPKHVFNPYINSVSAIGSVSPSSGVGASTSPAPPPAAAWRLPGPVALWVEEGLGSGSEAHKRSTSHQRDL